jgi:hypothetical protein
VSEQVTGDLTPGRWYRIVAISATDPNPTLKVGDVVECKADSPKCIDPEEMLGDDYATEWFADYIGDDEGFGTIVSKVEEVARPAQ